jgi:hypothetical protein
MKDEDEGALAAFRFILHPSAFILASKCLVKSSS